MTLRFPSEMWSECHGLLFFPVFGHASYISPPCWLQVPSSHLFSLTSLTSDLVDFITLIVLQVMITLKKVMSAIFSLFVFAVCFLDFPFHSVKQRKQNKTKKIKTFFFSPFEKKLTLGKEIITKYNHIKFAEKDIGWKNVIRFCSDNNSFTCSASEEFAIDSHSSILFHILLKVNKELFLSSFHSFCFTQRLMLKYKLMKHA